MFGGSLWLCRKKVLINLRELYVYNGNIKKIVDILSELSVPATIFCTGDFIERSPELIKYIDDNNVVVGNHMYSHKEINKISYEL